MKLFSLYKLVTGHFTWNGLFSKQNSQGLNNSIPSPIPALDLMMIMMSCKSRIAIYTRKHKKIWTTKLNKCIRSSNGKIQINFYEKKKNFKTKYEEQVTYKVSKNWFTEILKISSSNRY